ncbi:hypothetical protein EIB18_13390 [Caulobacter vibrioides]|nr:hypothetical protein CA608_20345 [Caulobacter vibrioides]AZH13609.1 hypothetical protein EIB18_13390 [Caulobacter vibrioides]PLR14475.1 hypothetical protein CVUC_04680 [Caulobacter vibrioides]
MRILCEPTPTVVLTLSLSKGEDRAPDAINIPVKAADKKAHRSATEGGPCCSA